VVSPLSWAEDVDAVLGGTTDANLGFQVEVVLAAELHLAHDTLRRVLELFCSHQEKKESNTLCKATEIPSDGLTLIVGTQKWGFSCKVERRPPADIFLNGSFKAYLQKPPTDTMFMAMDFP
jgi:hypothetical protein